MLPPSVEVFLASNDFSPLTVKAFRCDLRKFADWFTRANNEKFELDRITVRDVADFRSHLQQVRRQSVATVNRALVCIRRFLSHAVNAGEIEANPATSIKELRRMPSAPSGLSTAEVRRILREIEIRQDRKAAAIIGLMIHAGLRASEVVGLEMGDITIGPRSGQLVCREGKGNKQRTVPLSIEARRVLALYIESRPHFVSDEVFVGERGPLIRFAFRTCA